MSITTLEELEAIPVGKAIVLNDGTNKVWQRTEAGFKWDAINLTTADFTGAVSAGQVIEFEKRPIQHGDMFRDTGREGLFYAYVVIAETPANLRRRPDLPTWDCLLIQTENRLYSHTQMREDQLLNTSHERLVEKPAWAALAASFGANYQEALSNNRAMTARRDELLTRVQNMEEEARVAPVITDEFKSALQSYVASAGLDSDDELFDILTNHGVNLEVDHRSTVRVYGRTEMAINTDVAREYMPDVEVEEVGTASVDWSLIVTVTTRGNGCTCPDVNSDDIRPQLPERLRALAWDYDDVECA